MKIVVVTDTYLPNMDGVVVSVNNSITELAKRGHKIVLLAPDYEIPTEDNLIKNCRIYRFPSLPLPSYPGIRICSPNFVKIRKIFSMFNPNIIHLHTLPGFLCIAVLMNAKVAKKPVISTYHTSFPKVALYMSPAKLLRLEKLSDQIFQNISKIRQFDLGIHQFDIDISRYILYLKETSNKVIKPINITDAATWAFTNRFYNRSDHIITPTSAIKKDLQVHNVKPDISVISNGIRLSRIARKREYKTSRFICVSRLGYEKRIDVLLKAMSIVNNKYPDISLTIVGKGPAEESLKRMAENINVKFSGFMDRENLLRTYAKYDVFVSASDMETQGLVFLEAMAAGLPAIGVNALAVPEVIKHKHNGYLVEPGDYPAMAKHMITLIEKPELIREYGKNARLVAENHNLDTTIDILEHTYKKLINQKNSNSRTSIVDLISTKSKEFL